MKLGYFGDGPWAVQAIHKILNDKRFEIAFVVVRYRSADQALRQIARAHGLPLLEYPDINSAECIADLKEFKTDLYVSMSFDQIFKTPSFQVPKHGIINCHAGDLPRYRGRNVINWAIINGEDQIGITVHSIDSGIDTGNIILKDYVPVTLEDDYASVLEKCFSQCAETLFKALQMIARDPGVLKGTPQAGDGFYCKRRSAKDENLDWKWSAMQIHNFVRAITRPAPGAKAILGGKTVRIWKTRPPVHQPQYVGKPGEILQDSSSQLIVKTGDSHLEILDWTEERR